MSPFDVVSVSKVPRSAFNLSYKKIFSGNLGYIIPICCDEMVPNDRFRIGGELVFRFQPLYSPIMHDVNVYVNYFFVPYRLLWDDWESFITGGEDGTEAPTMPTWDPGGVMNRSTLWDYLGFPTAVDVNTNGRPIDFPRRAYNLIYNEFYRAQEIISEVALTNTDLLLASWDRDYFTTAALDTERGTAPGITITGTADVSPAGTEIPKFKIGSGGTARWLTGVTSATDADWDSNGGATDAAFWSDPELEVDFSNATGFDISQLRLAVQTQKFLERNQRAGSRLGEFIRSHFNVTPEDSRLQRPEYIGGFRQQVVTSEVLQTESSDATTPLGEMGGHGLAVGRNFVGTIRAKEHGLIMGLLVAKPRPIYTHGVNRQWLRYTKLDFYFPEFANLSEQAIYGAEIKASATDSENTAIFGYIGRYDEMRHKMSMLGGQIRRGGDFDHWTMARAVPTPTLNQTFLECVPTTDAFTSPSDPHFFCTYGNIIKAIRPMPYFATPGVRGV